MKFVVIGGGIGGVCCVEELCRISPDDSITLISASTILKGVGSVVKHTDNLEEFEVIERDLDSMPYHNLIVRHAKVETIDTQNKKIVLVGGEQVEYDKVCLATGATPKKLSDNENVITVRDTESVEMLAEKLQGTKRAIVVGNGGIAMEVLPALSDCEVIWVLKHRHIGDAFFDIDAAQFLLDRINQNQKSQTQSAPQEPTNVEQSKCKPQIKEFKRDDQPSEYGHALGPKWVEKLQKQDKEESIKNCNIKLEFKCLVEEISDTRPEGVLYKESDEKEEWAAWVKLSNGVVYGCDVIISAIGVSPNTQMLPPEIKRAQDGGVEVDLSFQSSVEDVYGIGDCCSALERVEQGKQDPTSEHWFQMRLWTQARVQGTFVAHVMAGLADDLAFGFNFELFTHATRFFWIQGCVFGALQWIRS
eukprot:TRINITY_DN7535_c0_g1_i2.p1 TRINITY_DN7535_c0_g1~~TRINITY_DN7535_c0_g1_i2.p1  ORF type:complete len:429 (-),score=89.81 TRINITY_DN7535_c0_g1_i2:405-1658(-)